MDKHVNEFGRYLLNLCKTVGIRIVNGRHVNDEKGSFTFYNANGTSLIDYVLADTSCINNIEKFHSGNFNSFSDHSAVSFSLRLCYIYVTQPLPGGHCNDDVNVQTGFKWIEENTYIILETLHDNFDLLKQACHITNVSEENINICIETFHVPYMILLHLSAHVLQ